MTLPFSPALRQTIRENLARFERRSISLEGRRAAGVAVVVGAGREGQACLLLTRRASSMPAHAGQWALPGGRATGAESPARAALRETHEEIGLGLADTAVMGTLDDYATRSGYVITPVVVWHPGPMRVSPDPREVAGVFEVPLAELGRDEVPRLRSIPESERPVLSVPLPSVQSEIHAPTAAILFQFWEVACAGRPTRVAHYEQPVFAWR